MEELIKTLNLDKWYLSGALGDEDNIYTYRWNTIRGIARVNFGTVMTRPSFEIIAIENDVIGNGRFHEFIAIMEKYNETLKLNFSICQFFNPRLREWFRRRGYRYDPSDDEMSYVDKVIIDR